MRDMLLTGLILAAILLQGCVNFGGTSPEPDYYLLTAGVEAPAATGAQVPGRLGIGPIIVPDFLDRPQIVTRNGSRVTIADRHRWAEPLETSIGRVVATNLERLHPGLETVDFLAAGGRRPERSLRLDIRRFDGTPGREAVLDIQWQLIDFSGTAPPLRGHFQRTLPLSASDYPTFVTILSDGLEAFSRELPLP